MHSTIELATAEMQSATHDKGYITKAELATRLRRSRRTVDNLIKDRSIPYVKLHRAVLFDWSAVQAHIRDNFTVRPITTS